MLKGFRDFIVRGNVIDLAVGVIMGAAFKSVVDALVTGLLEPLIAAVFGKPDISHIGNISFRNATFAFGEIATFVIHFLIVAIAVYFFIVLPMNKFRAQQEQEEEAQELTETELLKEIRDLLREQSKDS